MKEENRQTIVNIVSDDLEELKKYNLDEAEKAKGVGLIAREIKILDDSERMSSELGLQKTD